MAQAFFSTSRRAWLKTCGGLDALHPSATLSNQSEEFHTQHLPPQSSRPKKTNLTTLIRSGFSRQEDMALVPHLRKRIALAAKVCLAYLRFMINHHRIQTRNSPDIKSPGLWDVIDQNLEARHNHSSVPLCKAIDDVVDIHSLFPGCCVQRVVRVRNTQTARWLFGGSREPDWEAKSTLSVRIWSRLKIA
ncbi:hypothetical protein VP01_2170g2 [Puccinia sorghi]|uniref:Uncharacterized protein n=1 Tax=Puccinia sorghi TaxID=27349 RepID=A0A0L6V9D9_9BASI|nr:hypothetical protein VP01_2170g2 [Puccinia sorghi]